VIEDLFRLLQDVLHSHALDITKSPLLPSVIKAVLTSLNLELEKSPSPAVLHFRGKVLGYAVGQPPSKENGIPIGTQDETFQTADSVISIVEALAMKTGTDNLQAPLKWLLSSIERHGADPAIVFDSLRMDFHRAYDQYLNVDIIHSQLFHRNDDTADSKSPKSANILRFQTRCGSWYSFDRADLLGRYISPWRQC
jgi:hypothetical protein